MLSAEQIVNGITVLTVSYAYDVFGYQISRTETVMGSAASVTKFAYDISDRGSAYSTVVSPMWAELDASGTLTMRYFLGDGEGEKLARSNATEAIWMLTDRQGSVRC